MWKEIESKGFIRVRKKKRCEHFICMAYKEKWAGHRALPKKRCPRSGIAQGEARAEDLGKNNLGHQKAMSAQRVQRWREGIAKRLLL